MARTAAARKTTSTRPKRERGYMIAQVLNAVRLLVGKPQRPTDLMAELEVSRRTVERLLRGLEACGLEVESERSGLEVFYRLSRDTVRKKLAI